MRNLCELQLRSCVSSGHSPVLHTTLTIKARELFTKIMSDAERMHLFNNIAEFLKLANSDIQEKTIMAFGKVHADYAQGIRKALAAATIPPAPAGHADI
jgi:catalase